MSGYVPMAGDTVNKHLLMIAAYGVEPRLLKPVQYIYGIGAAVDEVPHGKDAIQLSVEV
ncbi:hypothetical protein D3C84_1203860 [compost metagenome]